MGEGWGRDGVGVPFFIFLSLGVAQSFCFLSDDSMLNDVPPAEVELLLFACPAPPPFLWLSFHADTI